MIYTNVEKRIHKKKFIMTYIDVPEKKDVAENVAVAKEEER